MNCPNCGAPRLRTIETFQVVDATLRTKCCRDCTWKFTTEEKLAASEVIPETIRDAKRRGLPVVGIPDFVAPRGRKRATAW